MLKYFPLIFELELRTLQHTINCLIAESFCKATQRGAFIEKPKCVLSANRFS